MENQTCDLLACSAVPQPTAPLCVQKFINYGDKFVTVWYIMGKYGRVLINLEVLMEFLQLNLYAMLLPFVC
jgi:hypothetical protein